MDRRRFVKSLGGTLVASTALINQARGSDKRRVLTGLGILQGFTTGDHTELTIDLPKTLKVNYSLHELDTGRVIGPTKITRAVNSNSSFCLDSVVFDSLAVGYVYELKVIDSANKLLDSRFLRSVDLAKQNPRISVMSCMRFSESGINEIWAMAEKSKSDYFFFIGDAIYGDSAFSHGPDKLWSRGIETRDAIPMYRWKNLVPTLAIWDDHDYGKNNTDGNYEHKNGTLQVFRTFFPRSDVNGVLASGPGVSFSFKAFNHTFVFLDSRFYRKLKHSNITGFLGDVQLKWLTSQLKGVTTPVWILEGSPFFGRADKSNTSYQATAPQELDLFCKTMSGLAPAVYFGGDLHYSEISRIDKKIFGYETYEFISSCMHSSLKGSFFENPNTSVAGTLKQNFLFFDLNGQTPEWKVGSAGITGALFSQNFSIG